MKSLLIFSCFILFSCAKTTVSVPVADEKKAGLNKRLTRNQLQVIEYGYTEKPFTGLYDDFYKEGTYLCQRCKAPLYSSDAKFDSRSGWPSFEWALDKAVKEVPDGRRTELICASCGAHLGHIFRGEKITPANVRHCINSVSLDFIPSQGEASRAYFAGGCFWGMETLFNKKEGVLSTTVGYSGGTLTYPEYEDVLKGGGHKEVLEVVYDPEKISYRELAKFFFEIHDPEQIDGQGPDIGDQYLSVVYYLNETQKNITLELIEILKEKGYKIATEVLPSGAFWPAEEYHQDYYEKSGGEPYCHFYMPKF